MCVAQQKGNAAFFQFVQAVFDTQENSENRCRRNPEGSCNQGWSGCQQLSRPAPRTPAAAEAVAASVKLAKDLNVNETPTLFVNGRPVPVTGMPVRHVEADYLLHGAGCSACSFAGSVTRKWHVESNPIPRRGGRGSTMIFLASQGAMVAIGLIRTQDACASIAQRPSSALTPSCWVVHDMDQTVAIVDIDG